MVAPILNPDSIRRQSRTPVSGQKSHFNSLLAIILSQKVAAVVVENQG